MMAVFLWLCLCGTGLLWGANQAQLIKVLKEAESYPDHHWLLDMRHVLTMASKAV